MLILMKFKLSAVAREILLQLFSFATPNNKTMFARYWNKYL